jgi:streptogramin lyase
MAMSGFTLRSRGGRRLRLAAVAIAVLALGLDASTPAPASNSNRITYYSATALDADIRPFWITPGPDGNMWFTDTNSDRIGRITMKGHIKLFKAETASKPYTIVTGPDGNLWFTEQGNQIGRVTTSGAFTEFPIPTPVCYPSGITTGPDGNLWFTEFWGNKIGYIRPAARDATGLGDA